MKKNIFIYTLLLAVAFSFGTTKKSNADSWDPYFLNNFELPAFEGYDEEKPLMICNPMPRFPSIGGLPGGKLALRRYIGEYLVYPPAAIPHMIKAKVNVEFIVEKNGDLSEIKTIGKKYGFGIEEEAIEIFDKMPFWEPGKQDGYAVRVYMMIPLIFTPPAKPSSLEQKSDSIPNR